MWFLFSNDKIKWINKKIKSTLLITINYLTKKYKQITALDQINTTIEKNKITGLLGVNGAGKSTLMKIISASLFPTKGNCLINNKDVFENPREIKKEIGYLAEVPPLYEEMSVESYLMFASELKGLFSKQKRKEAAKKVITVCQLEERKNQKISTLSKGYKQRVGIAMAFIGNPKVLILDEPSVGLDPNQIVGIRDLIKKQSGNKTIIISSHILQEIEAICDNVILINKGKIIMQGNIKSLKENFFKKKRLCIQFTETEKKIEKAVKLIQKKYPEIQIEKKENELILIYEKSFNIIQPKILRLLVENQLQVSSLLNQNTSLENIFKQLTKKN